MQIHKCREKGQKTPYAHTHRLSIDFSGLWIRFSKSKMGQAIPSTRFHTHTGAILEFDPGSKFSPCVRRSKSPEANGVIHTYTSAVFGS